MSTHRGRNASFLVLSWSVRRGGDGESGGWVVSHVDDAGNLVIVDTTSPGGEAQSIIESPARVPAGFHGTWGPVVRREGIGG